MHTNIWAAACEAPAQADLRDASSGPSPGEAAARRPLAGSIPTQSRPAAKRRGGIDAKNSKIEAKTNKLVTDAESVEKARLAAEAKVNEERDKAIAEKKASAEAAAAE